MTSGSAAMPDPRGVASYDSVSANRPVMHNAEVAWDEFSPSAYWKHNYRYLRADDSEIIGVVAGFFEAHLGPSLRPGPQPVRRGVDVGAGPNLYPALSM